MAEKSGWQRWVRQPQLLGWRRALVQVHLWLGLAVGVYITLLSVTGSAIVLRPDLHRWIVPRTVPIEGEKLTGDALQEAVRQTYPLYQVTNVSERRRAGTPVMVTLEDVDGVIVERLFDPYAARDLGLMYPPILEAVEWVVDLHDNLLADTTGRTVNGIGALAFLGLLITGAVVWWPGSSRWRSSIVPGKPAKSTRFAKRLHYALGFWSLALLFLWAITGAYFAFPDPVEGTMDYFDDDLTDASRPGEAIVRTLVNLHFGRFGGMTGRITWIILGLIPAVLFVTGFVTWWVRVRQRRGAAARAGEPAAASADASAAVEEAARG
jgi:uncharacterized iron-regulated membrane protein